MLLPNPKHRHKGHTHTWIEQLSDVWAIKWLKTKQNKTNLPNLPTCLLSYGWSKTWFFKEYSLVHAVFRLDWGLLLKEQRKHLLVNGRWEKRENKEIGERGWLRRRLWLDTTDHKFLTLTPSLGQRVIYEPSLFGDQFSTKNNSNKKHVSMGKYWSWEWEILQNFGT